MNKLKTWLYNRFLPAWCKDDLLEANARLSQALAEQRQENDRLRAYISGMQAAVKRSPRIYINGEVKRE